MGNPFLKNRKRATSLKEELRGCSEKDIDLSFTKAIQKFQFLQAQRASHYKFITYDGKSTGTHRKLYSWVKVENKALQCLDQNVRERDGQPDIFPRDVKWESRVFEGKSSIGEIIY